MKHLFSRFGLATLLLCLTTAVCPSVMRAQDAATTYKGKCAMCHGADGKGSAVGLKLGAHDFTSADVQKQTDAQLSGIITNGKGKMPAYKGKLQDTEIKDLVAYVRSLAK